MYWVVWVRGIGAFGICGLKVVWCGRGRKSEGMGIGYLGVWGLDIWGLVSGCGGREGLRRRYNLRVCNDVSSGWSKLCG